LERGWQVHVAASDTGAAAEVRAQGFRFAAVPLVRASVNPVVESTTLLAVMRLYARLRPDIVHHSTIKANVYGSLAARALRVPAVVNTVTGLGHALMEKPEEGIGARVRRRVAQALYAHTLTGVTVFQNTEQMRFFVERAWVRAERARLVRGAGVDLKRFSPALRPEAPLCVLPARMLRDKGVGEFVAAARALKGRARFALVGGLDLENRAGIARAEIEAWVQEGAIEWWGHRSDMPEVFRSATLVVLPSYAEGMPLALAEAQACGRACITTDAPGCREAIRPGETGLLVGVRDSVSLRRAIETLLDDPARVQRMGHAARLFAEAELGVEAIVAQTLDAFRLAGASL
jgi:glycosyltransferase involved in cell wall biosynthesis